MFRRSQPAAGPELAPAPHTYPPTLLAATPAPAPPCSLTPSGRTSPTRPSPTPRPSTPWAAPRQRARQSAPRCAAPSRPATPTPGAPPQQPAAGALRLCPYELLLAAGCWRKVTQPTTCTPLTGWPPPDGLACRTSSPPPAASHSPLPPPASAPLQPLRLGLGRRHLPCRGGRQPHRPDLPAGRRLG